MKQLNISKKSLSSKKSQKIKLWPEDERPRERLRKYGPSNLSDAQLLAIILRTGDSSQKITALDLARNLLYKFKDFQCIDSTSITELCEIKGIGIAKAAQLKAALEIGKRMASMGNNKNKKINNSMDIAKYCMPFMRNIKKEIFKVLMLDSKNKIMKEVVISEGDLNSSIVHPREVFNPAVKESTAAIIFVHNHPSGDPTPSGEDIKITDRLRKAGEILGIKVLDHIIIGNDKYFSFLDEKMI